MEGGGWVDLSNVGLRILTSVSDLFDNGVFFVTVRIICS